MTAVASALVQIYVSNMYTRGQKFPDFFLHVSNRQINLFWIATEIWYIVVLSVVYNLYMFFFISVFICYASVGIKGGPEVRKCDVHLDK